MPHFPMFINLKDQSVLVVGGGTVALRKLQKLSPFGAKPVVIAPEISPDIAALPGTRLHRRGFRFFDLYPRPALVIAATDDKRLNHRISSLCQRRRIPVNVADDPEACSFLFPALVSRGCFSAGISTGGASPSAAAYFKDRLNELLPENLDEILSWLEAQRPALKASVPDQRKRAGLFRALFDACMVKGAPLTAEEARTLTRPSSVGSVALVGAGCGKADLITVKGLRLLRQCQAVVYDDLIDPALLEAAPESALRIYMGKRSGAHSAPQSEINQKLIELARSGLQVVRLKGGDPYLFGRGGEEMAALLAVNIPCQEVPGIPSAIGIPAEAGIPVTHRGISQSLHIITAHTADTRDGLPKDFDALARLSGTLVFLMGLRQLPKIVSGLMAAGKSGDTPAAVLSGGSAPKPAFVRAPLSRIAQAADEAGVTSPAIILVGQVAAMDLTAARPLDGLRVGLTGTEEIARKQQHALTALGAETIWLSRAGIRERPFFLDLDGAAKPSSWLVFTSANGVRAFFRQVEPDAVRGCKFAVIGKATGAALAQYDIRFDLCPEEFTSEALAAALLEAAAPEEKIFLLRSSLGSPVLPQRLAGAGFSVRDIPLYDLEPADCGVDALPPLNYLTFSSAGGVKLFFKQYNRIPDAVRCVCIGRVTAEELSRHLDAPFSIAEEASVSGIVSAILKDRLSGQRG